MSKSVIYAGSNTSITTTATGTVIPFTNIVRRYGCNLSVSGGNVVAQGEGYYEGVVNLTVEGTVADTITVNVYEDGVIIPYANATVTLAAGSFYSLAIPFEIRNKCCCERTITVEVIGVSSVTNSAILVEKN